ncbi:MAG: DUF192 domain-containing protein [Actinobacteria bacterium]|nr:DUF192 domain-containing protein [Actinomycetota bacterium]
MTPSVVLEPGGVVLATRVRRARTLRERTRGLVGAPELVPGECLWIERPAHSLPGDAVHTFGMRYAVDVLFCDRDGGVRHVIHGLRPGRVSRFVPGARYVLELPAGTLDNDLAPGGRIIID